LKYVQPVLTRCHIIDHEDNEMMQPYNVALNPARLAKGSVRPVVAQNKPTEFGLDQIFPNPFNPSTETGFALPEDSRVQLKMFIALGQEVQTLIDADAPGGT
jgi:enhancing lycopene biosynthesis protein 2